MHCNNYKSAEKRKADLLQAIADSSQQTDHAFRDLAIQVHEEEDEPLNDIRSNRQPSYLQFDTPINFSNMSEEVRQARRSQERKHMQSLQNILHKPLPQPEIPFWQQAIFVDLADSSSYIFAVGLGACVNTCFAVGLQYIKNKNLTLKSIDFDHSEYTDVKVRLRLIEYLEQLKNDKHSQLEDIIENYGMRFSKEDDEDIMERNEILTKVIDYVKATKIDGSGTSHLGEPDLHMLSNIYNVGIQIYTTSTRRRNCAMLIEHGPLILPKGYSLNVYANQIQVIRLHYCKCIDPLHVPCQLMNNVVNKSGDGSDCEIKEYFDHKLNHYNLILHSTSVTIDEYISRDDLQLSYYHKVQDAMAQTMVNFQKHRNSKNLGPRIGELSNSNTSVDFASTTTASTSTMNLSVQNLSTIASTRTKRKTSARVKQTNIEKQISKH